MVPYNWFLPVGLLGWLIFISRWNFFAIQWGQIFWGWIWQRRWRQRGWSWTLFMFCFLKILHQDSAVGLNHLPINLVQVQAVSYHTFSVPENLSFFLQIASNSITCIGIRRNGHWIGLWTCFTKLPLYYRVIHLGTHNHNLNN